MNVAEGHYESTALKLQRPLPDGKLAIVATGEKKRGCGHAGGCLNRCASTVRAGDIGGNVAPPAMTTADVDKPGS
jgi:hypothetical protein